LIDCPWLKLAVLMLPFEKHGRLPASMAATPPAIWTTLKFFFAVSKTLPESKARGG
jgi:hypothetical protein